MIASIGELLIDLISVEEGDLKDVRLFEKHPGGPQPTLPLVFLDLGLSLPL